jgi:urease accessory protein
MNILTEIELPVLRPLPPQRAVGRLALSFRAASPLAPTRIEQFYQEGCLKSRLPRPVDPGICEAVLMNISGGIAGGDTLATSLTLGAHASACIAGQATERIYRALGHDPARITTQITVGQGASLDYLPQETILFDGFSLHRTLEIDLAEDARFLCVESLVFGRHAMGEQLQTGSLRDRIGLRRNGKTLLTDMVRLEGDVQALLGRKALANGAGAMATLIYAAPDAAARLEPTRALLDASPCEAGASLVHGVLLARLLAPSSVLLRATVVKILCLCRDGRALPRVWQS